MNKRMVSLFTLIAFIVFTFSCYSTKVKTIETVEAWKGKKGKILQVLKTSGEQIEFSKKLPGRIMGDKIVGVIEGDDEIKIVSIPLSEVKMVWLKKFDDFKAFLLTIIGIPTIAIFITGIMCISFVFAKKF